MEAASEAFHYYGITLFGCRVHGDTVIVTGLIIIFYLAMGLIAGRRFRIVPTRLQSLIELMVAYFEDLCTSMMGSKGKKYLPYILSIFLFVLSCNWLGLLPSLITPKGFPLTMPPTRDISTTAALALISFFAFQYFGFREHGWKYVLHWIHPIPILIKSLPRYLLFMIPPLFVLFVLLNIVEELARVLSLSVRLMGNILGEHTVASSLLGFVVIIMGLSALVAPVADILPLFVLFLGMLTGLIQAFIFSVLTLSYISSAVEEEH
ncbi:MAG: F0F1 ATP synthase subunit A [Candidatus Eremiobacteraeota bacterium]|nr:F0F1 ATP synthase subunit A [Candidatus Eremiobacteraeota bacterium]